MREVQWSEKNRKRDSFCTLLAIMQALNHLASALYDTVSLLCAMPKLILHFLVSKYFLKAPRMLGGWEGTPHEDICASITTLPASHFTTKEGMLNCAERIANKIEAWQLAVTCLLLGAVLIQMMCVEAFKSAVLPCHCWRLTPTLYLSHTQNSLCAVALWCIQEQGLCFHHPPPPP